jgi:WD40 repeat protein
MRSGLSGFGRRPSWRILLSVGLAGLVGTIAVPAGVLLYDRSPSQGSSRPTVPPLNAIVAFRVPLGLVHSVAFSPDGKTLAISGGDGVRLWDLASRHTVASLPAYSHGPESSAAFSPDGKTLATGEQDGVRLWNVASHRIIATLPTSRDGYVSSVVFSPDGKIVASGGRDGVRLWNVASHRTIRTQPGQGAVNSVAFSPDGKTLAIGTERYEVRLWNVSNYRIIATATFRYNHFGFVVAFSPDGKTLAIGQANEVRLWDPASLRTITVFPGPGPNVVFSPDGKTLASGGDDGVRLWDVASRSSTPTHEAKGGLVNSVAFSPDGRILAGAAFFSDNPWQRPFSQITLWKMR